MSERNERGGKGKIPQNKRLKRAFENSLLLSEIREIYWNIISATEKGSNYRSETLLNVHVSLSAKKMVL